MLGWELPPYNSGGLGVACYNLAKELARNGAEISFILPYTANFKHVTFMRVIGAHPQDVTAIIKAGGAYDSAQYVHIKTNGDHETHSLFDQQHIYSQNVGQISRLLDFDVIHAHDWLTFKAALLLKRQTGKPLVAHIHSTEFDRSGAKPGNSLVHEIEYEAMSLADKVITVSNATKELVINRYQIPPEKIEVVHNSVNLDDFDTLNYGQNVYQYLYFLKQHGYKVVGNIGRLTIQKGLTHLLDSARLVIDKLPKTIFLIVGSGDQYEQLIEYAAELGIAANIMFAGFQRGQAWKDAYRIADLFVMPSVSEPFGLTPLESIIFGTPTLVSNQSGVSEVINNTLRVDFWDSQSMADQIINALRHDSLRQCLASNAREEVNYLSWSDSAVKLKQILSEVAS